jgi:hypothetical protein
LDALQFGIGNPNVRYLGGYRGQLSDSGESFRLERPDLPPLDDPGFTPYVSVDEVTYDEHAPWPTAVGAALARVSPVNYAGQAGSWVVSSHPGLAIYEDTDFTGDGTTSASDVDRLLDAIQQGANHSFFDVNSDGAVNAADIDALLATIDSLPGDANLDGAVNAADLNQVGLHWQQARCATWSDGDFTGDGIVNAADLNVVGLNWLRTAAAPPAAQGQRPPRAPLGAAVDDSGFSVTEATDQDAGHSSPGPVSIHQRHLRREGSRQPRTPSKPFSNPDQREIEMEIEKPILDSVFARDLWLF